MPGFLVRGNRGRGLGLLLPTNVPPRMRPWTDTSAQQYQNSPAPGDAAQFLRDKAAQAEALFKSIGGRTAANPNAVAYESNRPPWIEPPDGYQPFVFQGIINTPNANDTDTTVLALFNGQPVPQGWDGVIEQIANFYTGNGFQAGAGQMVWRITENAQPFKTFDKIQVAWGTITQQGGINPYVLSRPLRIFSGDVIKYIVNHSSANPLPVAGSFVVCLLAGYIYPKRGEGQ